MSDVITRNVPATYDPRWIAFRQDQAGNIVAVADFTIRNADGETIDRDHPTITLTAGERSTFLTWFLDKLAQYEAATGLDRWTPPA